MKKIIVMLCVCLSLVFGNKNLVFPVYAQEENGSYTDAEVIKAVQQALNNAGYDCGTVDGVLGDKTEEAIKTFEVENNIDAKGLINDE